MGKEDWYFLVGTILGLIALLGMDWELVKGRFYMPHLDKRNVLTGVAIFASIFFSTLGWYHSSRAQNYDTAVQLVEVNDKAFINQIIEIDGKEFRNCTFRNVTLMFHGKAHFAIEHSNFDGVYLESDNKAVQDGWVLSKGVGLIRDGIPFVNDQGMDMGPIPTRIPTQPKPQ